MKRMTSFSLAIVFAIAGLSANVHGQLASTSESTLDFGSVSIGVTGIDMVTVTNISNDDIAVMASIASGPFSLISLATINISPGFSHTYEVHFEPVAAGDATAVLVLDIFSPNGPGQLQVELIGTGGTPGTPLSLIGDIIAFFDASIADGTLTSTGPVNSKRYKALRNRLRAVDWLIRHGYYCQASYVLQTAILRADGLPVPPDFVQGSNLGMLNDQMELLQIMLNQ